MLSYVIISSDLIICFGDIDKVIVSNKIRFADIITSLFFTLQAEC